jgi:hypothetical protein
MYRALLNKFAKADALPPYTVGFLLNRRKRMAHSRKSKLKSLQRRYEFLQKRVIGNQYLDGSFDEAEMSALKWAIDELGEEIARKENNGRMDKTS